MTSRESVPVVFILHAYQPITQNREILERIMTNCYIPFFENLLENKNVRITLNISGCLLEKLAVDYPDVLTLIEKAILANQIELMGSAFYHPILPFISIDNQKYQIGKQKEFIQNILGLNTRVFFPPELAVSEEIIPQIIEKNYEIVVIPDNSYYQLVGGNYFLENGKSILTIKRDKEISNKISFDHFKRDVSLGLRELQIKHKMRDYPIVLAMDLETFGEHHEEYYKFFFELAAMVDTIALSKCAANFPITRVITEINSTSWSTSEDDLENDIPYPLWDHPENPVHQLQHTHIRLLDQIKQYINSGDWLDEYHAAQYSCQFWWASRYSWSQELIHTGLKYQRNTLGKMIEDLSEDSQQIIFNLSNDIIKRIIDIVSKIEEQK
ncbi:MAG: Alpha-amylase [Candidatus Heimdallarchaeota archaeon AB_125]|nr:MAG: Alpha-amylase [Candidatus Heimdallarchaeota archaeon AB_125]